MRSGRLRRLSPSTVLLVAEALVLAVTIELALRSMPFVQLVARLQRLDRLAPARSGRVDVARLQRVGVAVCRLLPLRVTCLRESLVFLALLRRRGQPARLQIGVSKASGNLAAHAWVDGAGSGLAEESSEFFPLTPICTQTVDRRP